MSLAGDVLWFLGGSPVPMWDVECGMCECYCPRGGVNWLPATEEKRRKRKRQMQCLVSNSIVVVVLCFGPLPAFCSLPFVVASTHRHIQTHRRTLGPRPDVPVDFYHATQNDDCAPDSWFLSNKSVWEYGRMRVAAKRKLPHSSMKIKRR